MNSDEKRIAEETFNEAYMLYYESIHKFCLSRLALSEFAPDCTQDVFLVFYNRLVKGEHFEYPRAFLYKTAVNIIKQYNDKHIKREHNEIEIDESIITDELNETIERISYEELKNRIESALNPDDLLLFRYYFIEEMKVKEIAVLLNVSPTTCATRLHRLRNKLKSLIESYQ